MNRIKGEQLLSNLIGTAPPIRCETFAQARCSRVSNKSAVATRLVFFFVEPGLDSRLDFFVKRFVVFQNFFSRVATLGELCALVVQPGTALFDDLFFQCKIEKRASQRNSFVIHDVELSLSKCRRDLAL